ncbi:hypothetical protein [Arenimonas sp.]|uniref:hypothetical protein n=1 Tax=Arenimonas sp. TaxID=1872635 RepID=UPI0039E6601D
MIEPLRTPLVLGVVTFLCWASGIATVLLGIASARVGERFFVAIDWKEPRPRDWIDSIRRRHYENYDPLPISQMDYLKHHGYDALGDASLRLRGRRLYLLILARTAAFVLFLLAMLARMALVY